MDERLKGLTILVGKEPLVSNLCVSFSLNGVQKVVTLGEKGSVPKTVSRCKPNDGMAHCKIVIDQKGNMTLHNMKEENVTFVNGVEIESKRIAMDSQVKLGANLFEINVKAILEAVSKALGSIPKPPKEYSIKHLEEVWETYHSSLLRIRTRQKNIGLLRSIPMIFSMLGGLIMAFVGPEYRYIPMIFTIIAVVVMIYGFYRSLTDKSIEETEKLTEYFQNNYVCPNEECQHFMGNQPYNVIRKNKTCPYCRSKYTES